MDLSRDNAQLVFGSMSASDPITPITCVGPPVPPRFDIDMEGSCDGVGEGGVVTNDVTLEEGLAVVVGAATVPKVVMGGPGVSTAAQLGGAFLPVPIPKQGVKRGRGNLPIVFSAKCGKVFKEENKKKNFDKMQQRIRAAESLDPRERTNYTMLASEEENMRKRDLKRKKQKKISVSRDEVIRKLKGDTRSSSGWKLDV